MIESNFIIMKSMNNHQKYEEVVKENEQVAGAVSSES